MQDVSCIKVVGGLSDAETDKHAAGDKHDIGSRENDLKCSQGS